MLIFGGSAGSDAKSLNQFFNCMKGSNLKFLRKGVFPDQYYLLALRSNCSLVKSQSARYAEAGGGGGKWVDLKKPQKFESCPWDRKTG